MADPTYLIPGENGNPVEVDIDGYMQWIKEDQPGKIVRHTIWLSGELVSTCFLGDSLCPNISNYTPRHFETMLFTRDDGELSNWAWNAETRLESLWHHALAVARMSTLIGQPPSLSRYGQISPELIAQESQPN